MSLPRPSRRRRRLALPAAVLILAAIGCTTSSGSTTSAPARVPAPPASIGGTQIRRDIPPHILGLNLRDERGRIVHLSDWAGKTLVISDAMTLCQETCPLDTANLIETARAVNDAGYSNNIQFLTITVDPARDTPPRLAAYRKLFTPAPANWSFLTGTPATIAALWKDFGVYYEKAPGREPATDWLTGQHISNYDVSHSDILLFINGKAQERFVINGVAHLATDALPSTLEHFLNDQGRQSLHRPTAGGWSVPDALHVLSWLTNHKIGPSG